MKATAVQGVGLEANDTQAATAQLMGREPMVTLLVDGASATVRLCCDAGAWLGLVDEQAALTERLRTMAPARMIVHDADGGIRAVGEARAVIRPRGGVWPGAIRESTSNRHPFQGDARCVVLEVQPTALAIEDVDVMGAVPRT